MEWMILILLIAGIVIFLVLKKGNKGRGKTAFPVAWRNILDEKVDYYHHLTPLQKEVFEQDVVQFLNTVKIEGVETTVDITDKLLVASSAVIPVFGFPEWHYHFLKYVVLYPSASFDRDFTFDNREERITGMVGSGGIMEGRVVFSKPALHQGFANARDKKNVGIHEFIHLLDKQDGSIDGIPTFLNENPYVLPWLELIRKETAKISEGKDDDINPYAITNQAEFLTVTGEYFFENPQLLEKNHPELYKMLSKAFNQDPAGVIPAASLKKKELNRNDDCHCGSNRKFKNCCQNT